MIKEIHLENWKSFKKSKLYVDPLTILIGTNASGKSNILDALQFLQKISLGKQIQSAISGDLESSGIRGGVDWVINKDAEHASITVVVQSNVRDAIEYHYKISIGALEDNRIEIKSESLRRVLSRSNRKFTKKLFYTSSEDLNDPSIITYFNTNTQGRGKRIDLRRSYSVLSQSKSLNLLREVLVGINEVIGHLAQVFILDPIPSHMRNYAKLSDTLEGDASNISGVLAALEDPTKNEVEKTLTSYLNKLPENEVYKVWTEPIGRFNSDAMLYCSEKWVKDDEEFIVDARGLSDGTLRFLGIMTALLTLEPHSLLVVEEIDNGFHPSRANLLVQFLKEVGLLRKVDVICTTHNPAFLDALGNEMIVFISVVYRNNEDGSSEIILLEDISELPRLLARGKIGELASLGLIEEAIKK